MKQKGTIDSVCLYMSVHLEDIDLVETSKQFGIEFVVKKSTTKVTVVTVIACWEQQGMCIASAILGLFTTIIESQSSINLW